MSLATSHDRDHHESRSGPPKGTPVPTRLGRTRIKPPLRQLQTQYGVTPRLRESNSAPLATQIEHTHLRLRIAALERELLARDRQRQALIDQYERILEAREAGR